MNHIGGYAIIKTRLQVGYKCHHATTHSHELMSLVSINCVNNIECYWSRPRVQSKFVGVLLFVIYWSIF